MAEFENRIAQVTPMITFDPVPIPAGQAMAVIVSKQTVPFSTASSTWIFSSQIAGLPYIPAASLPSGTKWLVRYSCSFGPGDDPGFGTPITRIRLVSSKATFQPPTHGYGECDGIESYTPNAARGSHFAGWLVYTSNGTSDLEFSLQATGGKTLHYEGMILIAIPVSDTADALKLVTDTDIFYEQIPIATTLSFITPYETLVSKTATLPSGTYLAIGCAESYTTLNDVMQMRFSIDGATQKGEFKKTSSDSREHYSFVCESVVQLSAGSHTFLVEGGSGGGTTPKLFERARIILLRLDNFESFQYSGIVNELPLTTQYPTWQYASSVAYTPSGDQYVLTIANALCRRPNLSGMMMRMYDETGQASMHEYTSMCPTILNVTTDKWTMTTVGCELRNSQRNYVAQFATQSGSTPGDAYFSWLDVIAIGLTKVGGAPPTVLTMTFNDTVTTSDTTGAGLSGPFIVNDSMGTGESLSMTRLGGATSVPNVHPRLWLYGNDRLDYLRTQIGSPLWNTLMGNQGGWAPWIYTLKWKVTQSPSDLTAAITHIDDLMNKAVAGGGGDLFESGGLLYGDFCKWMCIMYDWLYDELLVSNPAKLVQMEDWMLQYTYDVFYGTGPYARKTSTGGPWVSWSTDNTANNYFWKYHMGAANVAITLYHHFWPNNLPAMFAYPYGSTRNRLFEIPISGAGSTLYQNFFQWFIDRFEGNFLGADATHTGGNAFDGTWKRYGLSRLGAGGGWHEGSTYGQGVWRAVSEIMSLMSRSAGVQWAFTKTPSPSLTGGVDLTTPYMSDRIMGEIYWTMPQGHFHPSFGDLQGG